jgi:hypothetical protein
MKSRLMMVGAAALLTLSLHAPTSYGAEPEANLSPPQIIGLDRLARQTAEAFPKVETTVTAVDGGIVTIGAGRDRGLRPGWVMNVYRAGREFTHPLTQVVLGRQEQTLGRIEISEVREDTAMGRPIRPVTSEMRAGDGARITAGRVPVAVIPGRRDTNSLLFHKFTALLSQTGRFRLVEEEKTAQFLKSKQVSGVWEKAELEAELGRELKAEYLLVVTTAVQGTASMAVRIVAADTGREVARLDAVLDLSGTPDPAFAQDGELRRLVRPQEKRE